MLSELDRIWKSGQCISDGDDCEVVVFSILFFDRSTMEDDV